MLESRNGGFINKEQIAFLKICKENAKMCENGEIYESVLELIENGTPIASACRICGVDIVKFNRFCDNFYDTRMHCFNWKDRICLLILGEDSTACENFDETYNYLKTTLSERQAKILELRLEQELTLKETAKALDLTEEKIRQIEASALRKLKHPLNAKILYEGV